MHKEYNLKGSFTSSNTKLRILLILSLLVTALYSQSKTLVNDTDSIVSDSLLIEYLSQHQIKTTKENNIHLLKSGEEKFTDLFAAIDTAKNHIHMEYFNFRNDSIANTLFRKLAVKVREGVKVRLLFDAFGNFSNNKPLRNKHLKRIRKDGIEIEKFDPLKFPYINHAIHRDHRKIVVIDGKIGYTGGMNVADYYIKGLPKIGKWRDTHMRIQGEAVGYLQKIFLYMWEKTTKQHLEGKEYFPYHTNVDYKHIEPIAIVDRSPRKSPKLLRRTYVEAIDLAQRKIQIVSPYFLPTCSVRKAIKRALKRGVEVEIMISAKVDIPFTPLGSVYVSHKLMKKGAKIYLYQGGINHSKVMMVDCSFCTIGTANLDSRSLRYDYEVNAFIFGKETTSELMNIFEKDKKGCYRMTNETYKSRSKCSRIIGWVANIFTPFL